MKKAGNLGPLTCLRSLPVETSLQTGLLAKSMLGTASLFKEAFIPSCFAISRLIVKLDSSKWIPHNEDEFDGVHPGRCLRTNCTHCRCLVGSFVGLGKKWRDIPLSIWEFLQLFPWWFQQRKISLSVACSYLVLQSPYWNELLPQASHIFYVTDRFRISQ